MSEALFNYRVFCEGCGAEIGEVRNGNISTYDNYCICEKCEKEFCGKCCSMAAGDYYVCDKCYGED